MSVADKLRELSTEEIQQKEKNLRQELFNLRFQQATHQLENVMRIRAVRRSIARTKTVLAEKIADSGV
ncbi:MAG: 50S ribosomal protein L29 [Deltaproteobacteria bacterium]|nr:50S ribosomal protein L29 [Deltaproteobacteria bacterium]MBW1966250.1 50S ribosomal protein L29 [Deltaproteobacteria bacterium]MBW2097203.1 50S ribosomal protein L29 [Deltaproteobacteria bacterium]PXF53239.1 MAG: 50S ribosomal protein L29 [Deltaproteobacteria bacterium]RKX60877.1 MAG: 50S ribosomal protein L29 [Thermodesulfobacteriota bacterium]